MQKRNTKRAFLWIIKLLKKHNIPFQLSGGFAARLYGSKRRLADIDIGIPDKDFKKIIPDIRNHISYGPKHYKDKEWDLNLITLKYMGQKIDIAGRTKIKIFDKIKRKWVPAHRDLTKSEKKMVYGLEVTVIPKKALIAYKKKIMREVDIKDIKALNEN